MVKRRTLEPNSKPWLAWVYALARVAWVLLALLMLFMLVIFTHYYWVTLHTDPCKLTECNVGLAWLEQMGFQSSVYGVLYLISFVIPVGVWIAVAWWIFLSRPSGSWGYVFALAFLIGWYSEICVHYLRGSLPDALRLSLETLGLKEWAVDPNVSVVALYWRSLLKWSADNVLVLLVFAFPLGTISPPWARWYLPMFFGLSFGWGVPALRGTVWNPGTWIFPLNLLMYLFLVVVLLYGALQRFKLGSERLREQIRVIYPILVLNAVINLLNVLHQVLIARGVYHDSPALLHVLKLVILYISGFALVWLAIAVTQTIVRQQLFDIRFVLNRALAYGAVVLCSGFIYVLIVGGLGTLLRQADFWLSVLATGVIAVLFQPLLSQFRRFANRVFYGERQDPYQVIRHLGRKLETVVKQDELLGIIVQTVASTLQLPFVQLVTPKQTVSQGQAIGQILEFPMQVKNLQVGVLRVSQRFIGESFLASEIRLLEDLTARAASAVQEALLSQEIQASQQAIVLAREEERKRIRRDLHDGLGASLAGIAMNLQVSKNLILQNPTRAEDLVATSAKGVQEAISDIRRLVYDLRPPALDDLGLEGALRQQLGQMVGVLTEIHVDVSEMPAALEVAVYRITSEALNNIQKHAQANQLKFNLYQDENGVLLEIADNGVGIAPNRTSGVGLQSMRERTQELGGRLEIENHHGTRVLAWLPLHKGAT